MMANTKDEWSNSQCIKLIELYRTHTVLWDTTDEFYYSAVKKEDAWADISAEMNVPAADLAKKMKSLMASFRTQKAKGTKSVATGKGRKEVYISKWFAFKHMLFLIDRDKPRGTVDTIHQNMEENSNLEEDVEVDEGANGSDYEGDYESAQIIPESQNDDSESMDLNTEPNNTEPNNTEDVATGDSATVDNRGAARFISKADHTLTSKSGRSRRKPAEKAKETEQLDRAFKLLEKAATGPSSTPQPQGLGIHHDKHTTFALHIAEKLREYSSITVAHVQFEINKILFAADLGQYDRPAALPSSEGSISQQSFQPNFNNLALHTQHHTSGSYGSQSSISVRSQSSTLHSYMSQPPTTRSYVSQPPTPPSNVSHPPTPHSYLSQSPTHHSYMSQPPTTHLYVAQPLTTHSNVSQPPTPHSYVSQPPTTDSDMSQPLSPKDIGLYSI